MPFAYHPEASCVDPITGSIVVPISVFPLSPPFLACQTPVNPVRTFRDLRRAVMLRLALNALHFRIHNRLKVSVNGTLKQPPQGEGRWEGTPAFVPASSLEMRDSGARTPHNYGTASERIRPCL